MDKNEELQLNRQKQAGGGSECDREDPTAGKWESGRDTLYYGVGLVSVT